MSNVMYYLCVPFGYVMKWCWELLGNYGLAIILFTLATKVVLMPLSVWLQYNSIKMVRIQPELNFMKAKFYGDADRIGEEQSKLFKREKYNPFAPVFPMLIQIFLLLCVVEIIYHPLTYILHLDSATVDALAAWAKADTGSSSVQLQILRALREAGSMPESLAALQLPDYDTMVRIAAPFCGFDLSLITADTGGLTILVPVIAGVSSLLLCIAQNLINPLQAEQGKLNKYGMTVFSVGLSLYLGCFVPAGIALYWMASNLLAILVQLLLNLWINPKKYIDYDALEKSRQALAAINALGAKKQKTAADRANEKREKADYKRFFKIVNKHIVIYSERGGFYKYYKDLVEQLLRLSNVSIHYVTNDPDDPIFDLAQKEPRIKPYYIGIKKLITLMMKLEADIVLMTTPDLDKFYIKRSYMRKDIEYIYVPHDPMSSHMGFREGALDNFDTVFCTGPHIEREVRATEQVYGLPKKTCVPFGYPLISSLIDAARTEQQENTARPASARKEILIAPSWQEDNLLDSCIDALLSQLLCPAYHVTVRPHPEYMKRYPEKMQMIVDRYRDRVGEGLTFELDFSVNKSIYSSDLLITDWSGISVEFCYVTMKPALFINTKMKVANPNWQKIGITPMEIEIRNQVGIALDKEELDKTAEAVNTLLSHRDEYREKILEVRDSHLYNIDDHALTGARYVLTRLQEMQKAKK